VQLREWQDRFQRNILQPEEYDQVLLENLLPGATSQQIQFDIYSNAYVIRLLEALLSNYPALHQLLGDRDFGEMGRAYLAKNPPSHASIRWFGDSLAQFLEQHAPYDGLPILSELAGFEWALRHTIDAADVELTSVEGLQGIAPGKWGELQFALHPSATVLALQWNTPEVWQALTDEKVPPEPEQKVMVWIIYRQPDLVSAWRSVSSLELVVLECMTAGGTFSDMCEVVDRAVPDQDESALRSAELLHLWVEQGLISQRKD
jgi:hypothetical protein